MQKELNTYFRKVTGDESVTLLTLSNIRDPVVITNDKMKPIFVNESCLKIFKNAYLDIYELIQNQVEDFNNRKKEYDMYFNSKRIKIRFRILPLWKGKKFLGVVGVGTLGQIEDFFKLITGFESVKSEKVKEVRFKPKRLLPKSMQTITGNNLNLVTTLHKASVVAKTDFSVVIYGESGVGKQLLAEAIHRASNYSSGLFVQVNCAAIPDELIESELFGYDPHSFTDALPSGKIGKFEAAHGGTIFLDEVSELPLPVQAKLLRVVQNKEFEKIGGSKVKTNCRIIAAANKSLESMVEKGTFREDLYYRLNVISLTLKPLRERKDDLDILIYEILKKLNDRYGAGEIGFNPEVIIFLHSYNWPGNIRQLENALEYAYISAKFKGYSEICTENLPDYLLNELPGNLSPGNIKSNNTVNNLKKLTEAIEEEYLLKILKDCNNNKSAAIEKAGISRRAFYNKLKKLNL